MLDYVYGQDQAVANFVAQLIPRLRQRGFGPNVRAIGVVELKDDKLPETVAGMVYHNYDPDSGVIEMSGAALPGRQWLSRETLARIFQYPFLQVGCQMVAMRVMADNERLLRILAAYNFAFIGVPRLFGRDHDGVLCLLTREDWEANKFNKRLKHHLEPQVIAEAA